MVGEMCDPLYISMEVFLVATHAGMKALHNKLTLSHAALDLRYLQVTEVYVITTQKGYPHKQTSEVQT